MVFTDGDSRLRDLQLSVLPRATVNRSKYDAFREVKLRLDNISISLPWLLAVLFFIKQ
jgi:hypothetical protein